MNKGSTWWIVFFLIVVAVVGVERYHDYVVKQNFLLEVATACNPTEESCFVSDCDIDADAECDQSPYEKVEIFSYDAPKCLEEHACESFSCSDVEGCLITYCSEDTLEEGEACVTFEANTEEIPETEGSI